MDLDKFVGRKVNANLKEQKYKDIVSKILVLKDPDFEKEVEEEYPNFLIRYKMTGYMYTCEIDDSRINICINDDGVVTRVYIG